MENVQLYPAKIRVVPNVKLAKVISNLSAEKFERAISGNSRGVVEKRNTKKFGDVVTSYKIANADGFTDESPLTEFDAAVLSACISEQKAGNDHTTFAVILRSLTGKVTKGDAEPSKNQREATSHSVMKLMQTLIWIDDTKTNEALDYKTTDASKKCSAILPAYFVEKTVNGQDATVIYFDRLSPIMEIAEARNQILRYDTALLDVPNQNNTPLVITLKNYCMRRVAEIKLHKMTPTLTFADIFKKARISTGASRDAKYNARETVTALFEHLKEKGAVKSFELVKRGSQIYAVKFTY